MPIKLNESGAGMSLPSLLKLTYFSNNGFTFGPTALRHIFHAHFKFPRLFELTSAIIGRRCEFNLNEYSSPPIVLIIYKVKKQDLNEVQS